MVVLHNRSARIAVITLYIAINPSKLFISDHVTAFSKEPSFGLFLCASVLIELCYHMHAVSR